LLVCLFGLLIVLAILIKGVLERIGLPPLVGYLLLGLGLRLLDDRFALLGEGGQEVIDFLAKIGVAVLLFRVGLESDLGGLVGQLRRACLIWIFNILGSGAIGFVVTRWLLGQDLIPSLIVAVAMTATSVGIPTRIWRNRKALDTPHGELFLDVAELDDLSGVVLMGLLFAVLPALKEESAHSSGALVLAGKELGLFAIKLVVFAGLCYLFSRYIEKRYTGFFRQLESSPDPMLVVAGTGLVVAAAAGLMGFSIAIGAFFAGLVFSRDPQKVRVDANFDSLYELFSPFFFIGIAVAIAPSSLVGGLGLGSVLLVAAVVGKIVSTTGPAWLICSRSEAVVLGVSMIPRAEITMVILQRGDSLGRWAMPQDLYSGMILVAAATCMLSPPVLRWLLDRQNWGDSKQPHSSNDAS
jgi:Kef-type K+ transport system membrane component KefB